MVCFFNFLMFSTIFLSVLLFSFILLGIWWNHPFLIRLSVWKIILVLLFWLFLFSLYSLLSNLIIAGGSIFWIHLLSLLSFPVFPIFFPFYSRSKGASRKQTRPYLSILLLKFYSGNLIFHSTWSSLTSYVNETRGPITTPDSFPNYSCCAFSTWLPLALLAFSPIYSLVFHLRFWHKKFLNNIV